jgi:FixJ family two-component response regulator
MTPPFIAIIDDDEGVRDGLQILMRSVDFRAVAFPSAEAFVASEIAACSDCIITDVAMRGMSGLQLVRFLRLQGRTTPIILMSALSDADLERQAVSDGAVCLLRKPFEASTLVSLVKESLTS